jgi:protocatechuate 3,4-dioxygenase beta subunit
MRSQVKKIKVTGAVKNEQGNPISGAQVYLYQTDSRGWYAADAPHVLMNEGDMRHARLFGYLVTDAKGQFELHTVKPSGYPQSDLPAHIHVHVSKQGYSNYVTEFLFDDDVRLVGTIRENSIRNQFYYRQTRKYKPSIRSAILLSNLVGEVISNILLEKISRIEFRIIMRGILFLSDV